VDARVVVFCLDVSFSTLDREANWFGLCVQNVQRVLRDHVDERDSVGVVCYGSQVELVVPPTPKSKFAAALAAWS